MGAFRERVDQLLAACGQRDHQLRLAVLQEIGDLSRAILGIYGNAADAEAVEGKLVQDVVGPVLQQGRHAMAEAISGRAIERGERLDLLAASA